jgi:hypothetical protein
LPRCRSCCGGRPTAHRRSGRLLIVRDHARRRLRRKLATGRTLTSPISSDPGWYEPMPAGFRGLLGPGLHGATRRKMAAITGREHGGYRVAERLIVLPPMLQQREHIMTPAEIEGRRVIALRLFDALCAHYPDKYVFDYSTTRRSGLRLFRAGARPSLGGAPLSPATKPGASPPTSPSCRNSSAMGNEGLLPICAVGVDWRGFVVFLSPDPSVLAGAFFCPIVGACHRKVLLTRAGLQ